MRGRLGLSGAFSGRAGITGRLDLSFWDTHHVTTTYAAFSQTSFDVDVSTWDVSNVECMTSMFRYATGFTGDVSEWDVSNVTRMDEMFKGAAIFTGNVGSWEVGGVTNMQMMFMDAASFDCDLSGWNVTGLSSMSRMFSGAAMFNGNVGRWKVGLVTSMDMMFKGAESFDGDISVWDVGLVTDMYMMFKGANSFKADLGGWNVGNVSEMTSMFEGATALNSDLARWDVSSVINMRNMFEGATSFTGGGVENGSRPSVWMRQLCSRTQLTWAVPRESGQSSGQSGPHTGVLAARKGAVLFENPRPPIKLRLKTGLAPRFQPRARGAGALHERAAVSNQHHLRAHMVDEAPARSGAALQRRPC